MITVELSKAEALLYMEMIKRNTNDLLEQLANELDIAVTGEEMNQAAKENYVANLENENKALRTMMNAEVSDQPEAKPAKKKGRPAKPKAPWGYKKDGTPKKRPGRAPGAF